MEQIQSLGIVINSRIPCIPNLPERNPVVDRDLAAKRTELGHLIDQSKNTGIELPIRDKEGCILQGASEQDFNSKNILQGVRHKTFVIPKGWKARMA